MKNNSPNKMTYDNNYCPNKCRLSMPEILYLWEFGANNT